MLTIRAELIVSRDDDPLFDLVLRRHRWIKVIWRPHVDLLVIEEYREVEIVISLIDQVPDTKVKVHIDGFLVLAI